MQITLHIRTGFFEAVSNLSGGSFEFLLCLPQFFQFDLSVKFLFDASDKALQPADEPSGSAGGFGQAFWTKDNQGDNADQNQLAQTEIKHTLCFVFVFFMFDYVVFSGIFAIGAFVQPLFEVMNRAAEVFADVAQFFGAKYQNDDD